MSVIQIIQQNIKVSNKKSSHKICKSLISLPSLLASAYLVSPHVAYAEPSAELETIVITATKTTKSLSDSPIPVNVISQSAIQDNHPRTLKEAIQLLPNVILKKVHGKTGYEVIMQGLSSEQVLVLIDGLPVTASTGSTVNLSQYLNVEVEQIEVIQGASSSQYGSSAMGGVINVITKKIDTKKSLSGHVNIEVASNGDQNPSGNSVDANRTYIDTSVNTRLDKAGKLQARLSASRLLDGGLTLNNNKWARLKDQSEQTQVSARLQFQPIIGDTESQVWVEATNYKEDDESRFNRRRGQNIIPQQKLESIEKNRISAGFSHEFTNSILSESNLQATLFYEDYDSNSDTYSILPLGKKISIDRDANISTKLAQLQYDLPNFKSAKGNVHLMQIGGQWQQDQLSQTNNGKNELNSDSVNRDVSELYLQDDWLIGDNWELVTGLRYQQDSDFGGHIAPKIAIKYNHLNKEGREHIWRASVGKGYRVPNLKERYFVFDHSVYGYMVMGNPELEPETSKSYQLGYQGELNDNINFTANAYYNTLQDLIQADTKNPLMKNNIAIYQYKNVDKASTYGGDIGVNWQVDDNNQLQANHAFIKTKNETEKSELLGRPEHKSSLALTTNIGDKLRVTNRVNYESKHLVSSETEQKSPEWWTMDTKINYQATPKVKLYAGVNNLLDQQRDIKNPNDLSPVDNRQWLIGAHVGF